MPMMSTSLTAYGKSRHLSTNDDSHVKSDSTKILDNFANHDDKISLGKNTKPCNTSKVSESIQAAGK